MKTRCFAVASLALLIAMPSIFAVNDFWLSYHCSIGARLSVKEGLGSSPPSPKALQMPSYPIELFYAWVQGNAVVQFVVREDGTPINVSVSSTDQAEFGEEAKKAVERWSFEPGRNMSDGKAVPVQMQCRFDFVLDEREPKAKPKKAK